MLTTANGSYTFNMRCPIAAHCTLNTFISHTHTHTRARRVYTNCSIISVERAPNAPHRYHINLNHLYIRHLALGQNAI